MSSGHLLFALSSWLCDGVIIYNIEMKKISIKTLNNKIIALLYMCVVLVIILKVSTLSRVSFLLPYMIRCN